MKYQIVMNSSRIPQGWSMDIRGEQRRYRVGECIVKFDTRINRFKYSVKGTKIDFSKRKNGELFSIYPNISQQLLDFREVFQAERMKANSKLGQLL